MACRSGRSSNESQQPRRIGNPFSQSHGAVGQDAWLTPEDLARISGALPGHLLFSPRVLRGTRVGASHCRLGRRAIKDSRQPPECACE